MDDGFEAINSEGFIEGIGDCDILYNSEIEFRRRCVWVGSFDFVGFRLGSDGGDDFVALFEEDVEDMGGNETGTS